MIRLLVRLPVALLTLASLAWGIVLGFVRDPARLLAQGHESLARAYPRARERELVLGEARVLARAAWKEWASLGGADWELAKAGIFVAAVHCACLRRALPMGMLLGLAGLVAGLLLRERLREANGYASPTAAGLGRLLLGGGILWVGLFSVSPVGTSVASLYAAFVVGAGGAGLYAANLPLRL